MMRTNNGTVKKTDMLARKKNDGQKLSTLVRQAGTLIDLKRVSQQEGEKVDICLMRGKLTMLPLYISSV